jgi:DHA2 family multidrug resistance protein
MEALFTSNAAVVHSTMAGRIDPADPVVRASLGAMFNPANSSGLQALNAEVTRQASMVAYLDDFKLMMVITIGCLPLLLIMRSSRSPREATHAILD